MNRQELEELADQLETWMAAVDLYHRQTAKVLFMNIRDMNKSKLHPTIAEIQIRLAALDFEDLKTVFHETWNPMRQWERDYH